MFSTKYKHCSSVSLGIFVTVVTARFEQFLRITYTVSLDDGTLRK